MQHPLPPEWVDRVFARMAVRYGSAWLRMWEGLEMAAVRADWAQQLAGLHSPERSHALRYAIENLPADHPPTAGQFRALCGRAPEYVSRAALPAPDLRPNPEGVSRLREQIAGIGVQKDARAWARALKKRHDAGDPLTPAQVDAYRAALGGRRLPWESA